MTDKLIIDKTTRIIRCVTTEENPQILPSEEIITMPEKVILTKGFGKLMPDNQTIVDSSPEEQSDYMDILNPKRVSKRNLLSKIDEVALDGSLPKNLKEFVLSLKDFIA